MAGLLGQNRRGNALLCYAWGETDVPSVAIVKTTGELRDFISCDWLGESDGEEMESILQQVDDHDFSADDASKLRFDFEIGGVIIEDVSE